jgi:hypothetical protein
MNRLNRLCGAQLAIIIALAIAVSGLTLNRTVNAAESAAASATAELELLPDGTLAAVVVPQLNILDAKITALGQPLHAPIPPLLMMGKGMLGLRDGLKDDGAAVLAMVGPVSNENKMGTPLVIVGVTDYQKFIGQFSPQEQGQGITAITIHGQKMYAAKAKNSFAVLTEANDANQKLLERITSASTNTIKPNLAPLKDWLLQQDFALFGSKDGVALFLQHIGQHLKEAQQQQQTTDSVRELEQSISDAIPSVQKEITQIGIGLRIDDNHSIHLVGRAVLAGDGELTKAAAESTAPKDVPLAGLPSVPYLFAMDGSVSAKLKDWLTKFSIGSLKAKATQSGAKINDEDWGKLATAMNSTMRGSKATSYVMGIPQSGKSIYSQMYGLIKVDNAEQYLRDYETNMSQYATILKSINIPTLPVCDLNKIEMGDVPVLEMTMDMSGALKDMQKQGAPQAAAFTQMLLGGGRSTVHFAAAGPTTVAMAWGELENLKAVLESAKSPADSSLAADSGVKATAAMLPKGAQWRGFLNPAGYLEFIQNVFQMTMPQMSFHLPPFPNTAAVGFAAQLSPENLDVEMIVSGSVLEGAGTFTQQMRNPAMR